MDNSKQIKHLYARAGFGIRFEDLHDKQNWSIKKSVKKLLKASEQSEPLTAVTENIDLRPRPSRNLTEEERRLLNQDKNRQERALNSAWLGRMSTTEAQLREKMTLFWHNHFACNVGNSYYQQELNNVQRANALGNFKTMLLQVSQTPAMLGFLNNQQNKKYKPNENFARELMELFTLGRGHYTERDVKEAARAFTGWAYNGRDGKFKFNPNNHDNGIKTFLGKTGKFTGEDVLNIITDNKQTATYICTKLYRYFVNEAPNESHVAQMADVFYKADYEITPLLKFLFEADWFYDEKNIGNLIKSPVELLVGLNRQFYINYQNPSVLLQFQRALGQVLFRPPNVAGWPGGKAWIDSSSLMYRMKIPSTILNAGVIDFTGKATPEDEAYLASQRLQQMSVVNRVRATSDWDKFLKSIPAKTTTNEIARFMLEPSLSKAVVDEIVKINDLKTAVIQVVSTPEYQLC